MAGWGTGTTLNFKVGFCSFISKALHEGPKYIASFPAAKAAVEGGTVAGNARKELEEKSGTKVSTKMNYKELPEMIVRKKISMNEKTSATDNSDEQ